MLKKFFTLIITLLICITLSAQITVVIKGKVLDEKGAPIFGATVYLDTNQGNYTEEDGSFEIMDVIPGSYNLTASFVGYEAQTKFNIIVKSKGNPSFNFTLIASSEELDEVVISNKNTISRPKETPLSTQSLSAVEIATYPGGNNDVVQVAKHCQGFHHLWEAFATIYLFEEAPPMRRSSIWMAWKFRTLITLPHKEVQVGLLDCLMSLLSSMSPCPPRLLAHHMTIRFQVSYSLNNEKAIDHN